MNRSNSLPKVKFYVRFRWFAIVALMPFLILGLLVLGVSAYSLLRYDSTYFQQPYLERYEKPGQVARDLETALQTGDQELLRELQGLRWPKIYETNSNIHFIMLWERTDRFLTYLYFDPQTYERHPHYVEQVNGRWVVAPEDVYYYLYSGQWKPVFFPLAIVWWLLGFLTIGLIWLFRASESMRARLYGE